MILRKILTMSLQTMTVKMMRMMMRRTVVPPGCDQALYDGVLELREKRLDQDILRNFKGIDDLIHASTARERQIDKDMKSVVQEIQNFQNEKQRELNRIDVYVTLTLNQIIPR